MAIMKMTVALHMQKAHKEHSSIMDTPMWIST